jgi:transcription elongation factor GreB
MSRWRPPQPGSAPYITPQGYRALQDELSNLWKKRALVTEALSAAAAEGDRSENAEYIYRKKELAGIDRRLRYLQKRIPVLNVVDRVGDTSRVFFGALVTLEGVDGTEVEYRIVGADEIDSDSNKGYISLDSPMACAMLKKSVDDEVKLQLGDKTNIYTIIRISYTERGSA